MSKKLLILGIRGIPAKHGGFETFAERLARYLVNRGWEVTVYCQIQKEKEIMKNWRGINLSYISVPNDSALSSIVFDFKSSINALKHEGTILVFGYNTAILSLLYRLRKRASIINMDGLEWRRKKWNFLQKSWLYLNEHLGALLNKHLIADHPEIKKHLSSYINPDKITVIPYGSEPVLDADIDFIEAYNLVPNGYALIIARPEPENSILEIVSAFSKKKRGIKLVVLGSYLPIKFPYHHETIAAASEEVVFFGAIYEKKIVDAFRFYARVYIHGHTVGGTNPSLVEALAAGAPIFAKNNRFNRWVAGSGAHYFNDERDCARKLDFLLEDAGELQRMSLASLTRYREAFSDDRDLKAYEDLLLTYGSNPITRTKDSRSTISCKKEAISPVRY